MKADENTGFFFFLKQLSRKTASEDVTKSISVGWGKGNHEWWASCFIEEREIGHTLHWTTINISLAFLTVELALGFIPCQVAQLSLSIVWGNLHFYSLSYHKQFQFHGRLGTQTLKQSGLAIKRNQPCFYMASQKSQFHPNIPWGLSKPEGKGN